MMDILDKIIMVCKKQERCQECIFDVDDIGCLLNGGPFNWDIEAIRKALGDEPKNEIIVPEKWKSLNNEYYNLREVVGGFMTRQNKIINCLKQIKERLE